MSLMNQITLMTSLFLTDYALAGAGEIDEAFNKLSMDEENLDSALKCIEALCEDEKMP